LALSVTWVRCFPVCVLLLGACAIPVQAASPEDARRSYDAGHFADAMGIWAELSRDGNAEAAFGIGLMYDVGNGTEEDPRTAFFWYMKAAEAGLPAAEFNVAAMYDSGRGVAQNSADAALWYAKAAAHGHLRAEYDLALLYQQGDGVPHNPDAAAAWFRAAADGGLREAGVRLKALEAQAAVKRSVDRPTPVSLVSPERNATVQITTDTPGVELVWVAPPESQPVRYEVQVYELSSSNMPAVLSASVTATATLARLPVHPDFYVWNVEAVARNGSRVSSQWNWFSVGPAAAAGRSVSALSGPPRSAQ
jgi:hypothetical protein